MTISEYLKGSFDFSFSDGNIKSVLARRGLSPDTPLDNMGEKDIDLATADLYMVLASAASGGGKRVQKGNRSVSERSYQFGAHDRRAFRDAANLLYAKWGEIDSVPSSAIFVHLKGDIW